MLLKFKYPILSWLGLETSPMQYDSQPSPMNCTLPH